MRAGDTVLMRGIFRGKIRWAVPHRLVALTDERVALFLRAGTPVKGPDNYGGDLPYPQQLARGWTVIDRDWHTHHLLRIVPFGAAHEVDLFWTEDWHFVCWYVNLQEPLRRSPQGFDTFDQALDIVVAPDRRWTWKDEDELDDFVALGLLSGTEHARIRAEAERAIAAIEAWAPPFSEGWEHWRPPAEWTHAELPHGWDAVSAI